MNAEVVLLLPLNGTFKEPSGSSPRASSQQHMTNPGSTSVDHGRPQEGASSTVGFDAALADYRDELFQYLRRRVGDRHVADDLMQEALTRMMKYREADEIQDHKLMLFRIANNLVFEYHRTRKRHHAGDHVSLTEMDELQTPAPSVESIIDARRAIDILLKRTIIELPPKCRLAFMLSRFDGMSYPQIAQRMGISVKMVEKHITKALLACRAAVGDRDF